MKQLEQHAHERGSERSVILWVTRYSIFSLLRHRIGSRAASLFLSYRRVVFLSLLVVFLLVSEPLFLPLSLPSAALTSNPSLLDARGPVCSIPT